MDVDKIFWLLNDIVGSAKTAMQIAKIDEKKLIEKINSIKGAMKKIEKELSQTPGTGTGDTSHGARRGGVGSKE